MFIHPIVVGVVGTILVEIAVILIAGIIICNKKK